MRAKEYIELVGAKPILFSTEMVRAILRGEKTQTRRLMEPQPDSRGVRITNVLFEDWHGKQIKPKYKLGDILWIRETWRPKGHSMPTGYRYEYKATAEQDGSPTDEPWKPSIHMPKDACRIFLKVIDLRCERLEDMTKEDAIAEGVEKWQQQGCTRYKSYVKPMVGFWDINSELSGVHPAVASFRSLWASIYGFESLNANPWVFVYEFKLIEEHLWM